MTLTQNQRESLITKAAGQLEAGETVVDVTIGAVHVVDKRRSDRMRARVTSVLATDRRLIFFRKKWGGYDCQTLAYDQIQSVDHSKGLKLGELNIHVTGRDPVRVSSMPENDVERMAKLIREHATR